MCTCVPLAVSLTHPSQHRVCKGTSYTCDEPCERYDGSGSCPPTPHYCKINNKCYSNDAYVGDQCLFCHASSSSTVPTTIASVRAGVVCTDNNKCTHHVRQP